MEAVNIILVDDHTIIREGIKTLLSLNLDFHVIGEASCWDDLQILLEKQTPHVIILDIEMPGKNGLEIAAILQETRPEIKKIILSGNVDSETIYEAIDCGVLSILPKESNEDELSTAIRKAAAGEDFYTHLVSQMIIKNYINTKKISNSYITEAKADLSEREIEIIHCFSDGMSYKQIADKLNISPRTVESHKLNIMQKLELHTIIDIVKYAIKNNIITI
jgi:DNA-binding NarL/FixJ family response regulator